jgi:nucleoporin NDC1
VEVYQAEISALYSPPPLDEQCSLKEIEDKERLRVEVEMAGDALNLVGGGLCICLLFVTM